MAATAYQVVFHLFAIVNFATWQQEPAISKSYLCHAAARKLAPHTNMSQLPPSENRAQASAMASI